MVRGATSISRNRWTFTTRAIPGIDVERAQWRNTLVYRFHDDFQAGVEYNPLGDDVGPIANWRVVRETSNTPAVIIGTSSDRIGTPYGRSYYVTISKEVADGLGVYVGAMYGEYENKVLIPAGVSYQFNDHWSTMFAFDGVNGHPMVTYSWDNYNATFLVAKGKYPGISLGVGF